MGKVRNVLTCKQLKCCGYANSTSPLFVTDTQCPNVLAAANQVGCIGPFATYANNFLDLIFTGAFGIVGTYLSSRLLDISLIQNAGVDVALVLATTMLVKDRAEKERYRHIDEKTGTGAF